MDQPSELDKVRQVIQLARTLINQQKPGLAREHLRKIKHEVEDHQGTPEWAEHPLLVAETYGGEQYEFAQFAETHFKQARERIVKLADPSPELEFRLMEHFGDFYRRFYKR